MKTYNINFLTVLVALSMFYCHDVSAKQSDWEQKGLNRVGAASKKRLNAMNSALDMLEKDMTRQQSVMADTSAQKNMAYPSHQTRSKAQSKKKRPQSNKYDKKPCFSKKNAGSSFDVALQRYYFRYAEPDFMKEQDYMHGISFAYNWRNPKDPKTVFPKYLQFLSNRLDLIRVETDFAYGLLDYDSEGTGESQNDPFYMAEARGIAGIDFIDCSYITLTPYIGLGFRYLKDDSGGKQSSTGYYAYDRESRYLYCPIGIETNTSLFDSIGLKWTAEYDYFFGGKQISHLEDAGSQYSTLVNEQEKGYGVRTAIRITKKNNHVDFFVEPFVRYWDIENSELSIITVSGTPYAYGLEPENNSTEYGFKIGANF